MPFVSVPSPVFYGKLLEYEAEEASLPSERQGWRSIFSETIMLLCPSFPLYPSFVFCSAHLSFLPSCWISLTIFLFVMSCFPSPGKIEMLEWGYVSANGVFWQISNGTVSEPFPSTATASLEALFSSLWCTQPYVPLSFLGSDVLVVVGFERCHCIVRRSCSVLGFWEDCHLNLLLIDTLLSLKTWNQFLA